MKVGSIVVRLNAKAGKLQAVADLLKIHCCQYGNGQLRFAYMIFSLVSPCLLPSMLVRLRRGQAIEEIGHALMQNVWTKSGPFT